MRGASRHCSIAFAALLPLLAPAPRAQAPDRAWTLVREDLDVVLEPDYGTLLLEGTLVARLDRAETSSGPVLAINSRQRILSFESVHAAGASVQLNRTHPDTPDALLAWVRFPETKRRGDEVEVSFACTSEGRGPQFVVDASAALASWVEAWYPILPPPDGVSLGGATKVAGTTTFHLPEGWRALTNGALVSSRSEDGETVEVWESDLPLSRSFAAGPYTLLRESAGDLDVSLYLLSSDLPDPRRHVESLSLAIEAMEERWGPYPYPSYAIAEVPLAHGSFGASSEQGFILVKPFFLRTGEGNLPLFAHEAAHAWWGNTVGSDGPGSLLCSESLAQYGAVIAAERVWGADAAAELLRFSRPGYVPDQCARGYFEIWRRGADKPLATLVSGGAVDHTLSDAKGHWVYHMLRRRVGDERFFATMRALIGEFTGRTMTLDDVRARFVAAAPDAGLERFFAQWLDRAGAPVLLADWRATPEGTEVRIEQLQEGEPFDLRLDVALVSDGVEAHVERVRLERREQSFVLGASIDVTEVVLDPRHELLLWGPELGQCPVPGMEGLETAPLPETVLALYAGDFEIVEAGVPLTVADADGHLTVAVGGAAPERLVHTGGHRFRSSDGFVVFEVEDGRARSLTFVRDAGGTREARRRD